MTEHTFTIWSLAGPRDQTNCLNGWGRRTMTIKGRDQSDALTRLIIQIGRPNYGGLVK